MKNTQYILSYIFTLIIGVLLIVYFNKTNIFEIIVVVIGVCFIIPSLTGIFMGFSGKKQADGTRTPRPWYVGTSAIAGLVAGVLLVAMPDFFVKYLVYTFAVIMIFAGIIQILFLSAEGRDINGMPNGWYIVPWLTVAAGVVILLLGPDRILSALTLVTGIVLTIYSINGLLSASAHKITRKSMDRKQAEAASAEQIEPEEVSADDSDESAGSQKAIELHPSEVKEVE